MRSTIRGQLASGGGGVDAPTRLYCVGGSSGLLYMEPTTRSRGTEQDDRLKQVGYAHERWSWMSTGSHHNLVLTMQQKSGCGWQCPKRACANNALHLHHEV